MIRGLTPGEARLADAVLGGDLDPSRVRLLASPWPFDRAFVPGRAFGHEWIVWPNRTLPSDFTTAPLRLQAVFVHEMVHVWQAQQGVNLLTGKLSAGDSAASYTYPTDDGCHWCTLNIEQQAMLVEHRFRLSRGAYAPAGEAFYERVLPFRQRLTGLD